MGVIAKCYHINNDFKVRRVKSENIVFLLFIEHRLYILIMIPTDLPSSILYMHL